MWIHHVHHDKFVLLVSGSVGYAWVHAFSIQLKHTIDKFYILSHHLAHVHQNIRTYGEIFGQIQG